MSSSKFRRQALNRRPGTHLGMELKQEFWDEFGLDLVIDGENIAFTQIGQTKFTPLLAKWGYRLANVRTVQDFKRILNRCNAYELQEANQKLAAGLQDPTVSEEEKTFIRKLLGPLAGAAPAPPTARQSAMTALHKRNDTAHRQGAGLVIHVDFVARKVVPPAG